MTSGPIETITTLPHFQVISQTATLLWQWPALLEFFVTFTGIQIKNIAKPRTKTNQELGND